MTWNIIRLSKIVIGNQSHGKSSLIKIIFQVKFPHAASVFDLEYPIGYMNAAMREILTESSSPSVNLIDGLVYQYIR